MIILWSLSYLGGILTILSPCILPVLPFVFSTAEQPFKKSGLPLLAGMVLTFAAVATLAVAGGSWVIQANQWGRWLALGLLTLFAVTLLSPALAEKISRPFTRFGGSLHHAQQNERGPGASFLLGAATGFLWAPCAGPILGLILTGAAVKGPSAGTTALLVAYALGAATALAAALAAGGRLLGLMKRYLGADAWVRRILGMAVLAGVVSIVLGWDRGLLTRVSKVNTEVLEQKLVGWFKPAMPEGIVTDQNKTEDLLSALGGVGEWINSPVLTSENLKGKVVLIDFWTYSCINCLRTLPYVKAWHAKYKDHGLVIIGVHTPEFAFEKDLRNVKQAVKELGVTYPVAQDNDYKVWNAFENRYWPAHYFIDAQGKLRHTHFGEGEYETSEEVIRQLLREIGVQLPADYVQTKGSGAQAPAFNESVKSPETYIGSSRAENRVDLPGDLKLNQWSLIGMWDVKTEHAELRQALGRIVFRFQARDLHLVLGPGPQGAPVRFRVKLDGSAPAAAKGMDIDASGQGVVREQRLYQLIRQSEQAAHSPHTFEIEFLDSGAQAFAFTFG